VGPSFLLGRVRGIPVRIHWSAPFGALFFGGLSLSGALAWLVLILAHEAGHAVLAWRLGSGVIGLSVHAFGGECQWVPGTKRWSQEIISWGGVLAQGALLLLVVALSAVVPLGRIIGTSAIMVLTGYNVLIIVFNLLPVGNLDGRRAWRLLGALRWSNVQAWRQRRKLDREWGESKEFQRKLSALKRRS
jgi:Zn-dependent protease